MALNKVMLIGRLGSAPEYRIVRSDLPLTTFSLATTSLGKEGLQRTEWHRITTFGRIAETAKRCLGKGSQVYIEGRIHYSSYEINGTIKYSTEIIASFMWMLGPKRPEQNFEFPAKSPHLIEQKEPE